jgi:hypothetical protein
MTESRSIRCERHGTSEATFACVHIADGAEGCGFCLPSNATDPWPDATCEACTRERRIAEWSEEVAARRVRLLCKYCWENAFARSSGVAAHPNPKGWIEAACERAARRQEQWMARHGIGSHRHWQMDLAGEAPWLGWGESATRIHVRGEALVIGSWSKRGNSWLWGWGNSHWEPHLTAPFVAVKRFGEAHGIEPLWRMGGQATEDDGFAFAAVALDLVPEIEGIYRAPSGDTSLFLAVKNTQLVS